MAENDNTSSSPATQNHEHDASTDDKFTKHLEKLIEKGGWLMIIIVPIVAFIYKIAHENQETLEVLVEGALKLLRNKLFIRHHDNDELGAKVDEPNYLKNMANKIAHRIHTSWQQEDSWWRLAILRNLHRFIFIAACWIIAVIACFIVGMCGFYPCYFMAIILMVIPTLPIFRFLKNVEKRLVGGRIISTALLILVICIFASTFLTWQIWAPLGIGLLLLGYAFTKEPTYLFYLVKVYSGIAGLVVLISVFNGVRMVSPTVNHYYLGLVNTYYGKSVVKDAASELEAAQNQAQANQLKSVSNQLEVFWNAKVTQPTRLYHKDATGVLVPFREIPVNSVFLVNKSDTLKNAIGLKYYKATQMPDTFTVVDPNGYLQLLAFEVIDQATANEMTQVPIPIVETPVKTTSVKQAPPVQPADTTTERVINSHAANRPLPGHFIYNAKDSFVVVGKVFAGQVVKVCARVKKPITVDPSLGSGFGTNLGLDGASWTPNSNCQLPEMFIAPNLHFGAVIIQFPGYGWQNASDENPITIAQTGVVRVTTNQRQLYYHRCAGEVAFDFTVTNHGTRV